MPKRKMKPCSNAAMPTQCCARCAHAAITTLALVPSASHSLLQQEMPSSKSCSCCGLEACTGICALLKALDDGAFDDGTTTLLRGDWSAPADDVTPLLPMASNACEDKSDDKSPKEATEAGQGVGERDPSEERPPPQEPPSERRQRKEQSRRCSISEGLKQLTKLIFIVDPQVEVQARKSHEGIGRAELASAAVVTGAHSS